MSPLDDNAMYLQLAQQAAKSPRGVSSLNPQAQVSAANGLPPNSQFPQGEIPKPPLPPRAIQLFVQNLPRVIPQITPQQAETLVKVLMAAIAEASRFPAGAQPPMETQPGAV